jgi:hypothetical protein
MKYEPGDVVRYTRECLQAFGSRSEIPGLVLRDTGETPFGLIVAWSDGPTRAVHRGNVEPIPRRPGDISREALQSAIAVKLAEYERAQAAAAIVEQR